MRRSGWQRWAWILLACAWWTVACATPAGETPMASGFVLEGEGPFQRFIVRYRAGSAPAVDPAQVPARVARTVAAASVSPGPELAWQRRLAVDADLLVAGRPLARHEAQALMEAFSADPDVEYIEVDGVMGIGPGTRRPAGD